MLETVAKPELDKPSSYSEPTNDYNIPNNYNIPNDYNKPNDYNVANDMEVDKPGPILIQKDSNPFFTETYPGASRVYNMGPAFMDIFNNDQFSEEW